jgi:hypothetical protein
MTAKSDSDILRLSALLGLAGGFTCASAYYVYSRISQSKTINEMEELKSLLLREL